jgi:hypothetical protein
MVRSKSEGPSGRLLSWTEYAFLVAGGIVALTMLVAGKYLDAAGGGILFWRVLTWLKVLRVTGKR